ncbi:putative 18S rRNA (guanine-N(7))-methyltransferase [Babylonia areolata]|uniref:putative 18S rRNA (guanine-N(7))-methyltransferase n=1 Tax=Babylonia areolata TaxID=304850 RepID=UPI003FCF20A3
MGFMKWQRIISGYIPLLTQHTSPPFFGQQKQVWTFKSSIKRFSHLQNIKQVYLFENSEEHCFNIEKPYKVLNDVKQLGVKTVKGGFRRRPELIRQKQPDLPSAGLQCYGLFDKCEHIQQELTEKMLCLMNVSPEKNPGCLMLDIGCGHGWSLTIPSLQGFCITGVDLDLQALSVVQNKLNTSYLPSHSVHIVRTDVSNGLCFRQSTFDVAISVSFLQWLCVGKHSRNILQHFFHSLSFVLKPEGKAGIQFYPRNSGDVVKVISEAQKYFKGALVSDFPHLDRGRKLFLLLSNSK